MLEILMPHPERFWLAARTDVDLAVDPDKQDGKQRWPDRDTLDWARIAALVDDAGARIARKELTVDVDGDQVIEVDDAGLTKVERRVVSSWLMSGEPPVSDPGALEVGNGRHRLWNGWKHAPNAVLPIHSGVLQDVDSVAEMSALESLIAAEASRVLSEVGSGVAYRSPHYVLELRRWPGTAR